MTIVKICGITNLDDALAAHDAGAGMLGFNFYKQSPRYIEPKEARAIIDKLPQAVIPVGVFVNEELETIEKIASVSGVSVLQLHGDESPEYCKTLKNKRLYVLKVFSTEDDLSVERIGEFDAQLIMLDAGSTAARGGTGNLSDWSKAQETAKLYPTMFLAGGLSPENVGDAIDAVEPLGVDACSSLESEPGKKNHQRVRAFVEAVRKARPHEPHHSGK